MITIPTQLCQDAFRFILIGTGDWAKRPIQKDWSRQNNYAWNSPILREHLRQGRNYGVLGGAGNLVIVDFDDKGYQDTHELPNTFTVKSGGRGLLHKYYVTTEPVKKFKVLLRHNTLLPPLQQVVLADVQGRGAFVVGPNSVHSSGRRYEVVNDRPIEVLTLRSFQWLFRDDWPDDSVRLPRLRLPMIEQRQNELDQIKRSIRPSDLIGPTKLFCGHCCPCPVHPPSNGNKYNLSFDDKRGLFYCFHTGEGGSVLDLEMHLTGCTFKEAIACLKQRL